MISTYLVAYPWLTGVALAALVLLGPVVVALIAPRPRWASVLTGAAAALILASTLLPTGREMAVGCYAGWAWPTLGKVEMMGNIVLFVPFVLALAARLRRPWVALVIGSVLSALIELVQALVPAIGRSCDASDWEANTLGSVLGAALAAATLWWLRRREASRART